VIRLASQSGKNRGLHYGVVLSHEAMRNGVDGGELGQEQETFESVLNHTLVAQAVAAVYGDDSLTDSMQKDVAKLNEAIENNNFAAFGNHALSSYDSSADYWKLIRNGDSFGFIDDHQTDFDLSILGLGKDVSPEEFARMIREMDMSDEPRFENAGRMEVVQRIPSEEEMAEFSKMYGYVSDRDYNDFYDAVVHSSEFQENVLSFVTASMAADVLMESLSQVDEDGYIRINEQAVQTNLAALNSALGVVQDSGLLYESPAFSGNYNPDNPLILRSEDDIVYNTSPRGYRYRETTEGNATAYYHWGNDFSVRRSDGARYENGEIGLLFNDTSTLSLAASSVYGFRTIATGSEYRATYSHLYADSVLDYISAFSMDGSTLVGDTLMNVPAGVQLGRIGHTGESEGPHLDLITEYNSRGKWSGVDPSAVFPGLTQYPVTPWAKVFAGHDDRILDQQEVFKMWKYRQNSSSYWPFKNWMTDQAKELGTLLEVWDE
jgi:hypothetical protein